MTEDLQLQLALARATLATIAEYMTNLGKVTGDWSVASPVLEMISEGEAEPEPIAAELFRRAEVLQRHECGPRTPIATATVGIVRLQGPNRPVWQLCVVGAPFGVLVKCCPFCGVTLS